MAVRTYLPRRESDLRLWSASFAAKISADPTGYGLTAVQAADYQAAQSDYAAAYLIANQPETRSPVNVQRKNTAKEALIGQTRVLVEICQAWPGMTNGKRVELGITPRGRGRTRAAVPAEAPVVKVVAVEGRLLQLKLREAGSDRKARPASVRSARLYTCVSEDMPEHLEDFMFRGTSGRTDTQVVMPESVPPGSKVWVSACWVNTAGKAGPASLPIATWTTHGAMQSKAA